MSSIRLLSSCLCCLFLAQSLSGCKQQKEGESNSSVLLFSVESGEEEFWEQPQLELKVRLKNPTSTAIQVQDISPGCDCTAIAPVQFTLLPGESTELDLVINTKQSDWKSAETVRQMELELLIQMYDGTLGNQLIQFPIQVKKSIIQTADEVQFSQELIHGEEHLPERLKITLDIPETQGNSVTVSVENPELLSANIESDHSDESKQRTYYLNIKIDPTLPVGPFETIVKLGVQGQPEFHHSLPVRGVIQPPVSIYPQHIALGVQKTGTTVSKQIVLTPTSGQGLELVRVEGTNSRLQATRKSDTKILDNAVFDLSVNISSTGFVSKELVFLVTPTDSQQEKPYRLALPVSYFGEGDN